MISKLDYSPSFQSALFLLKGSWRLYLCGSHLVASLLNSGLADVHEGLRPTYLS